MITEGCKPKTGLAGGENASPQSRGAETPEEVESTGSMLARPLRTEAGFPLDGGDVHLLQVPDEIRKLPIVAEPALGHLADGFFPAPALHCDPIDGEHGARAIDAAPAVNAYRRLCRVGNDAQKPHDVLVLGVPGAEGDDLGSQRCAFEQVGVIMEDAQGHDRLDAHFLELWDPSFLRLGTTVKNRRHLVEVR